MRACTSMLLGSHCSSHKLSSHAHPPDAQASRLCHEFDSALVSELRRAMEEADSEWGLLHGQTVTVSLMRRRPCTPRSRPHCARGASPCVKSSPSHVPPTPLGQMRLFEFHTYLAGGDLLTGFDRHYDGGSLLTMVVMLSDPARDFEGGRLVVSCPDEWESTERFVEVDLRQPGDCVVFPSHKYHNVTEVTRG